MAWHHRLFNIFRSNRISRDIEREMEFHIAEKVDDLIAGGLTEREARAAARRQFGNVTARREETREMHIAGWLQSVAGDARYAVRMLANSPVFAIVTIASLGLGIGANATIYSLLDAIVLRPLAVDRPAELAYVTGTDSTGVVIEGGNPYFTNPLWEQVRDRQDAFISIAAFGRASFNLADGGEARRITGDYVSGDFFRTFLVAPAAGRLFTKAEDTRGCAGSAVLSYRFWEREYGSSPDAIGKTIRLSGHPIEIAGVAESRFRGPDVGSEADVYVPLCAMAVIRGDEHTLDRRSNWWIRVIGRLAPDVDIRQANARTAAIARAVYAEATPQDWPPVYRAEFQTRSFAVLPAEHGFSTVREQYGTALFALMAGVALILLIACANVANLLLSRAEARHRELAVRLAIGAGRGRLLRQLITESMVLAAAGSILGLFVAEYGTRALVALITTPGPDGDVSLDLALNGRLLAFTILAATVTVVLCGVVPAWRATRVSAQSAMRAQSRGVVEGHSRFRLGKALVVAQVALSLVLVVSAGFLVGTLRNLSNLNPGFSTDGVLLATIDLRGAGIPEAAIAETHRRVLERVRAIPGVTAASSDLAPIGSSSWNDAIAMDGFTPRNFEESLSWFNEVSDGYFATMGTRLLAGRDFNAGDVPTNGERVAIVNDAWARRFARNESPLGRRFRLGNGNELSAPFTIIGLVENSKYRSLREDVEPIVFQASSQNATPDARRILNIRSSGSPTAPIPALRAILEETNPGITVDFRTLSSQISSSLQRERMLAILSAVFGSVALALAVLGLYGVTTYSVTRRRGELGVRIALGAVRGRVVRLVLGEVGLVVATGLVIGAVAARIASAQVAPFLYGTQATNPVVYVAASLLLAGVAFTAGLIPAMKAARLDPIEALREQ